MDSIFGLQGKGFAILASDMSAVRSILVYKHDEEKVCCQIKNGLASSVNSARFCGCSAFRD
jgi:hypothetical protein